MGTEWKAGLVSVIMPVYNAERFLRRAVDSVLKQTYADWELILVDDCSTDGSREVIRQICEETGDSRIRAYAAETNRGVAASRNFGLAKAGGQYIAFLDSDDLWYPEKLFIQVKEAKEKGYAFLYSACDVVNERGEKAGKTRMVPKELSYRTLLGGNEIPCLTVLIDRYQVPEVRMPLIPHEDYACWLKILREGGSAHGWQEPLAAYRVTGQSVSANKLRAMKWHYDIYRRQEKLPVPVCCFYMVRYIWRAVRKRV